VPSPQTVLALYDYTASESGELSFKEGEIIHVLEKDESGWWLGELNGTQGLFPINYTEETEVANKPSSETAPLAEGSTSKQKKRPPRSQGAALEEIVMPPEIRESLLDGLIESSEAITLLDDAKEMLSRQKSIERKIAQQEIKLGKLSVAQTELLALHQLKLELFRQELYFKQHPSLYLFYRTLSTKLHHFFLACASAQSGILEVNTTQVSNESLYSGLSHAANLLNIALDAIPYAKILGTVVAQGLNYSLEKRSKKKINSTNELVFSNDGMEQLAGSVAAYATWVYQQQISVTASSARGAQGMANSFYRQAIALIVTGLDNQNSNMSLEEYLVSKIAAPSTLKQLKSRFKSFKKNHRLELMNKRVQWNDLNVFFLPGLLLREGQVYEESHNDVEKYGARLCQSIDEAPAGAKKAQIPLRKK